MEKGDRIYYTGDMANGSSEGTILEIVPATKYGPESVWIKFDESRFEGDIKQKGFVYIQCFSPGPGRRFYPLKEWEAERQASLQASLKRMWDGFQANHPEPEKDNT